MRFARTRSGFPWLPSRLGNGFGRWQINGILVPVPTMRAIAGPIANGLVFRAEQALQFTDRLEVLGQKVWPHGDEKFLVTTHYDEIQNADIRGNRRRRASDIFHRNEGQAGFV